jgi:glycosyltransferase involved in cell wall biosynthesis
MKILFVHQNFPGQFLHLAPALAGRGHEVWALTAEKNDRASPVRVFKYRTPPENIVKGVAQTWAEMAERGVMAARAAHQMREKLGYVPDIVFGHGGWGETLFLREIWPEARHLTYAEFFYRPSGLDAGFDPEFPREGLAPRLGTLARRTHLLQAIQDADAGLAPTAWQASTFPPDMRAKINVIHDGIDTGRVVPDAAAELKLPSGKTLRVGDEVLSFVSRNLEPYRGFHIFMRALPEILARRPEAHVVIVGGEGQSYGPAPRDGTSWKQRLLAELGARIDPSRVHFTGHLPYSGFVALMQVTRVHAYLTYPFVLSWSMLEAMSAGALVVGSRTPPVEEVIKNGRNGRLVDFFDVPGWSDALADALADPDAAQALRRAARDTIVAKYDLKSVCLPKLVDFVERNR